jgi:large subunit ribosomal protein L19
MDVLRNIEAPHIKEQVPEFGPGDTVRIAVRVVEGDKVRSQVFQGVVIARANSGTRASFTVRKVSEGVAVERVFPLHSPNVTGIEVVRRGRVRRAKLTYMRGRKGRSARIRERGRERAAEAVDEGAAQVPDTSGAPPGGPNPA